MTDADADHEIFTLDEHLRRSLSALPDISAQQEAGITEKVTCHHFEFRGFRDFEDHATAVGISQLEGLLLELGIEFDLPLLEAADWVIPDREWVGRTVPKVYEIAQAFGLVYCGWTWEPRAIQPIGTTNFQVINNRSPLPDNA